MLWSEAGSSPSGPASSQGARVTVTAGRSGQRRRSAALGGARRRGGREPLGDPARSSVLLALRSALAVGLPGDGSALQCVLCDPVPSADTCWGSRHVGGWGVCLRCVTRT